MAAAWSQEVNKADTTTAVTSSLNPAALGRPVTLKAKVANVAPGSGTPTGTVDFYDGDVLIGSKSLSSGVALLAIKPTSGVHAITAIYRGSDSHNGSTSDPMIQVVDQP